VCSGLSVWQVRRYSWKIELFSQIEKSQKSNFIKIENILQNPSLYVFYPIQVKGIWEKDDFFVIGKMAQGVLGYHHLKILTLSSGQHLLVNVGWVSSKNPSVVKKEIVQVQGYVRIEELPRWGRASHYPQKQEWGSIDLAKIEEFSHLSLLPFYVETNVSARGSSLLPPERHLGYAVTWACLAFVALVMALKGKHKVFN
jgi:cytochrome oxidase assembly protein ShyY1